MSTNGVSYFLREVIVRSSSSSDYIAPPRALSIRGVATSSAFFQSWSLQKMLESASWRSDTVFTSFYLKDVQYLCEGVRSLGPYIAAGEQIG